MPGVVVNVAWPKGPVKVGPSHRDGWSGYGPEFEYVDSADPNDHYREELEKLVGRQGWDWNWGLRDNDVNNNTLTIKIRSGKTKHASYFLLKWS